jgi:hypothetical protein
MRRTKEPTRYPSAVERAGPPRFKVGDVVRHVTAFGWFDGRTGVVMGVHLLGCGLCGDYSGTLRYAYDVKAGETRYGFTPDATLSPVE